MNADYGVDLTFRQLLANYPTTVAAVEYLDEITPSETVVQKPDPVVPPAQAGAAPALPMGAATSMQGVLPSGDGSVTSVLQSQVSAMQTLFAQQPQVLSGTRPTAQADPASVTPAPTVPQTKAVDKSPTQSKAPFGFSVGRVAYVYGGDLSPEQLAFAQDLAERVSVRHA